MIDFIRESTRRLQAYVEAQEFVGYDPYDLLNSSYPIGKLGNRTAFLMTQVHKRNPVDLRPLLAIHKDYVPKGMGLFLKAYALQYQMAPSPTLEIQMRFILDWLVANKSEGYSGYCWGLRYPFSNRLNFLPAESPSIVVTSFVHDGIYEYYRATGDKTVIPILRSACDFVLNDLSVSEDDSGVCFSYTTTKKDKCLNANALGAQMLARTYAITGEKQLLQWAKASIDFTVNQMQPDGRWDYRIYSDGSRKDQTDFHQGFILESIREYLLFAGEDGPQIKNALSLGSDFYYKKQFLPDGRSMWRLPKQWPVDIHHQAQGIISFTNLAHYSEEYLPFAQHIAQWTIENMQDSSGYFYYRIGRFHVNKIPYIRWGQAWMMKALALLLGKVGTLSESAPVDKSENRTILASDT